MGYFLNKQVEEGLEAGFQAASSSSSASDHLNHIKDSEQHAHGRKGKRCKTDINDSIPLMGSHCSACWPRKRHSQPPEYAVVDGVAERLWKPIRGAAREEIKTFCPVAWKLTCDYESDDPIRAGMRPGIDLPLPGKTFVEYFQTEFKHRFSREHLADETAWDNEFIRHNSEWQKRPDTERVLEPTSLLGFERTSRDFHASHTALRSPGEGKPAHLQESFSSKSAGSRERSRSRDGRASILGRLPKLSDASQEFLAGLRSRKRSSTDKSGVYDP